VSKKAKSDRAGEALASLYGRPAFLIRRAHQIATAVFAEACAELDLTPSQYSALFVLKHRGRMGQNELARAVALDRSTTALVVKHLIARDLVLRFDDPADRRKSILELSDAGRLLLARAETLNSRASAELLSVFDPKQAEAFVSLLDAFAAAYGGPNGSPRAAGRRTDS